MNNSFKIFKSDNKTFHWDLNNFLLILFFFAGLISILEINIISKIAVTVVKCIFLFIFIIAILNIFRKKHLNGVLDGTIIFNQESIVLNDNKIELQEIKKIFLRANDYEGKTAVIFTASLFPRISNGTNNLLDLELKNGKKIKLFFQIEYESQVENLKPFLISLINNNLISIDEGVKILNIEYEDLKLELEVSSKENLKSKLNQTQ